MAVITRIDVLTALLPFRLSFGHALAERRSSTNVYVRLRLDDGSVGYGEGVPREYVTGETVEGAVAALGERFAPALVGRTVADADEYRVFSTKSSAPRPRNAAWTQLHGVRWSWRHSTPSASDSAFGPVLAGPTAASEVRYDAIVPFVQATFAHAGCARRARLGFKQVKIKVGSDLDADLRALSILRRILGPASDLRVDANCAWTVDEALHAIERMRAYRISAVETAGGRP